MSNQTGDWVNAHIHKSEFNANPSIGQQRAAATPGTPKTGFAARSRNQRNFQR